MRWFALALLLPAAALAQAPDADEIMRRVAANQARSAEARRNYVYDMNVFVRMKRANGKTAREESRDYVVAPDAKGAKRKLLKVEGRIFEGKNAREYHEAAYRAKDMDIDGAVTDSFAREVMWRKGEMGVMIDWFPLTEERRAKYRFRLEAEERYREYDVYRVSYEETGEDACWKGEALVEKSSFQPVLVASDWGCKIPTAVKILLGTTVSHIGAKIAYERFDGDVWFPVNCGGELKVRVLFLYARTIGFAAKNAGFRKTDVSSTIDFEAAEGDRQTGN